jgi:hypothetical protein
MSVKVSSWVWHDDKTAGINGNEMLLLLALADVADDNGRCRFLADEDDLTYAALAAKVRVDRRTIERLIPKLRERELVTHTPGTKDRPNEFAIAVPWAKTSTDKVSVNGSDSPTAASEFTDTVSGSTSLIRKDVVSGAQKRTTAKGSRMAEGWKPSPALLAWAVINSPSVEPLRETDRFVDYWIAAPGAKGVKSDWDATWRNWMRSSHERNVQRGWRPNDGDDLGREEWMLR